MSILATYATATPLIDPQVVAAIFMAAVACAFAALIAWAIGVFRKGSVRGPLRIDHEVSLGTLIVVTVMAALVWLLTQIAYGAALTAQFKHDHPKETFDFTQLAGSDFAFLSTVPFALGLAILLIGDIAVRQDIPRRLGYSLANLPGAIWRALLAMLIVLPLMFVASNLLDLLYRAMKFQHPMEHELLGAMKDASPAVQIVLLIGACVAAPFFEELLFRGHIQSILVRMFTPRPAVKASPIDEQAGGTEVPPPVEMVIQFREPSTAMRWLAVFITSLMFASFHPAWMAPLIFVLALCLGYAYERTGNLWVPILMHAIFNASSTVIFLNFT